MSIKKDEIWQCLIGNPTEFIVEKVYEDGWVNGKQVKLDKNGNKVPVNGTGFAAHSDTMKLTMKKVG